MTAHHTVPLAELPTHAGPVTLHYRPEASTIVRPDKRTLILPIQHRSARAYHPHHSAVEIYPLLGGRQFIGQFWDRCNSNHYNAFFGCDEQASFVTGVTDKAWVSFLEGGERGFFAALKPEIIRRIERAHGVTARRQGDINVVEVAPSWHALVQRDVRGCERAFRLRRKHMLKACRRRVRNKPILGTNHLLTGRFLDDVRVLFADADSYDTLDVATGTITGADHAPLHLGDRPHALARAAEIAPVSDAQRIANWEHWQPA
ncbi:MAG TPA: hypothetical protein VF438_03855 [Candidatus Paceibacterota bacterium]